jgi:hypothetical protein
MKILNKLLQITKIIFIIAIILCVLYANKTKINKEYVLVDDLSMLSEPYQESTSGNVVEVIDNKEVNIEYIASYDISGRVVKTYSYAQVGIENKLSPIDVGITWGDLVKDENNNKIIWGHTVKRFLTWKIYDTEWYNNYGGTNFQEHVSNNHLIPCNDDILKKINAIKEGEYIHIIGYLADISYDLDNGEKYNWKTSTSRSDTGDGACEIIYVTDIEWLTESH